MDDETTITEKPKTVVESTSTVTRTGPQEKSDETMIGGASGRFWVTITLIVGWVLFTLILAIAIVFDRFPKDPVILAAVSALYTGYSAVVSTIAGTYIGQGQKPKSQTQ